MSWVAAAVGAVSIGTKLYTDARAKKKAKDALKNTPVVDDAAVLAAQKEKRSLYENAYNTGMLPGQAIEQQKIIDSAAGTRANIGRNATSAAQRIALSGNVQGQQDQSMLNLSGQFGQQKMGLLGGLGGAIEGEGGEYLRRYNDNQATRAGLQQTIYDSNQNIANTLGEIGGVATAYALNKGFKKNPTTDTTAPNMNGVAGRLNYYNNQNVTAPAAGAGATGVASRLNFFNNQRGRWVYDPVKKGMVLKYN